MMVDLKTQTMFVCQSCGAAYFIKVDCDCCQNRGDKYDEHVLIKKSDFDAWNHRPVEDALVRQIADLRTDNFKLREQVLALEVNQKILADRLVAAGKAKRV